MNPADWPSVPNRAPQPRPCGSCAKFAEAWQKIKQAVNDAFGSNNEFLFGKYLDKAVEVLESLSAHCQSCANSSEVELQVQSRVDKQFAHPQQTQMWREHKFRNMNRISAEQDRHLLLAQRSRERVKLLLDCKKFRDFHHCQTLINQA